MQNSPFKDGRLAMSPGAMKIAAKALAKGRPVPAIMAGLRHDAEKAGGPLRLPAPIEREVMITGASGSGWMTLTDAIMKDVINAGYRIIRFTNKSPRECMPKDGPSSMIVWGPDPWFHGWEDETGISVMDMHAIEGDVTKQVKRYIDNSLAEDSVLVTGLHLDHHVLSEERKAELIQGAVKALAGRDDLADCVLVLERVPIGQNRVDLLRKKFAGVIRSFSIHSPENEAVKPDTPGLFGHGACIFVGVSSKGIFYAGRYGDRNVAEALTEVRVTFGEPAPEDGEEVRFDFHDRSREEQPREEIIRAIIRAIMRLKGAIEDDDGNLLLKTHTDRLNAVARACGYADWQAADGHSRSRASRKSNA